MTYSCRVPCDMILLKNSQSVCKTAAALSVENQGGNKILWWNQDVVYYVASAVTERRWGVRDVRKWISPSGGRAVRLSPAVKKRSINIAENVTALCVRHYIILPMISRREMTAQELSGVKNGAVINGFVYVAVVE